MSVRRIPVDLTDLEMALTDHGGTEYFLDTETGEILAISDLMTQEEKAEICDPAPQSGGQVAFNRSTRTSPILLWRHRCCQPGAQISLQRSASQGNWFMSQEIRSAASAAHRADAPAAAPRPEPPSQPERHLPGRGRHRRRAGGAPADTVRVHPHRAGEEAPNLGSLISCPQPERVPCHPGGFPVRYQRSTRFLCHHGSRALKSCQIAPARGMRAGIYAPNSLVSCPEQPLTLRAGQCLSTFFSAQAGMPLKS